MAQAQFEQKMEMDLANLEKPEVRNGLYSISDPVIVKAIGFIHGITYSGCCICQRHLTADADGKHVSFTQISEKQETLLFDPCFDTRNQVKYRFVVHVFPRLDHMTDWFKCSGL